MQRKTVAMRRSGPPAKVDHKVSKVKRKRSDGPVVGVCCKSSQGRRTKRIFVVFGGCGKVIYQTTVPEWYWTRGFDRDSVAETINNVTVTMQQYSAGSAQLGTHSAMVWPVSARQHDWGRGMQRSLIAIDEGDCSGNANGSLKAV